MARATAMQASVNAGELSPRMMGRIDQSVYSIAGEKMENFVPLIQGPMLKRSGVRHVATAKGPCRLIDFEFNTTQSYIVEAGNLYARFFTNDTQIMKGGVPYEIATPYRLAEVEELDMVASADVLYLVHGRHQMRTLSRTGAERFALAPLELTGGPFDDDNIDERVSVASSGATGDVTLTASATGGGNASIFKEGDVGGLFRLEARDFSSVPSWEPDLTIIVGELRTWDGKVYECVSGTRTGTIPPIHSEGVEWDGAGTGTYRDATAAGGVKWLYLHDRFGTLKITGYKSPSQVTATVIRRVPVMAAGTWRWAFGAFSATRGWPEAVWIWNERLVLAKGASCYASVVGSYADFRERNESGEITADMAFRFTLNSPNAIRWIMGDEQLLLGTAKKEHVGSAAGGSGVPGPGNFKAPAQTDYGSARVKPISVGGRVLFVEKGGRRLREMDFKFQRDRFDAPDLTILASHVTKSRIKWLARQSSPHSLVWVGMNDGTMACMAYSPEQEVKGWCRTPLAEGSIVRSGAVIPDPAGELDQLWVYVEHKGKHLIGRLEEFWDDAGGLRADAFFVDHGLSYTGDPVTLISGLEHLAGEEVSILADGAVLTPQFVSGDGKIKLAKPASKVHVGLHYRAYFKSLRIEAGGDDGTAQGKIKRINRLVLRVLETVGLRVKVQGADQWTEIERSKLTDVLEAPEPLFTGDEIIEPIGDYERGGQIEIESHEPLPACILAMIPTLKVGIQ